MMVAARNQTRHTLPPLSVVTVGKSDDVSAVISANLLKPVRPGVVADLSAHHVYVTGTRQPVRVMTIERRSCFLSQGYIARCWLPNQRQYRTFPLAGTVSLHFRLAP